MFAASLMKTSISRAENDISEMDMIKMLSAIKELKEYEL
jgi:hypothetical protein